MSDERDDMDDASFEEGFEDDFDPSLEADIDDEDLDLDDLDSDEDDDDDEESSKERDDYSDRVVESALKANPKRQQARKKASSVIEGIISQSELSKQEGQRKAWSLLNDKTEDALARPYSMDMELKENDAVAHPKFGVGFVIEIQTPTRVAVLFETGVRKMACNLKR